MFFLMLHVTFSYCVCNICNVLQLFAYDTVKKRLTPKPGEKSKARIPESLIAGAVAGISSTICTYPLELLKTRLTVQVKN